MTSRICAHKLGIEKGRYFQINRTERFCKMCNDLEIEDVQTISFGSAKNIGKKEKYYSKKYLYIIQVWTKKCAIQKASVDVNISYY